MFFGVFPCFLSVFRCFFPVFLEKNALFAGLSTAEKTPAAQLLGGPPKVYMYGPAASPLARSYAVDCSSWSSGSEERRRLVKDVLEALGEKFGGMQSGFWGDFLAFLPWFSKVF